MQRYLHVHFGVPVFFQQVCLVWVLWRGVGRLKWRLIALWETKGVTIMCSLAANLGAWVRSQGTPQVLHFKFLLR